jgi:O-antigen ligase
MAVAFYGFLLVALNWIVGWGIYDLTMVPRLLALMVFLAAALPFFALPRNFRKFDTRILGDPIVSCFGAYAATTGASLVFAVNPTAGFNDLFKTSGTFLVLCISGLLLTATPGWPRLLCRLVIVAAFGACAVGFYQMVSRYGLRFPGRSEAESVTGLMSNVNLYAGFLNLLLPFCLSGFFIQRGAWRLASAAAGAGTVLLIVLLQSRGAYIGLLAGSTVAAALLLAFRKSFGLALSKKALGVVGAVAVLLAACGAGALFSDFPAAQRIRTLFTTDLSSIDGGRLMIWGIALEMVRDHFLAGVGAGNFTIRMHEYLGRPGQDFSGKILNWAQPHHDFLWVFSEKGLFGFLAFSAVFALAFLRMASALRRGRNRARSWVLLATAMGLTAYLAASCFDFPLERINQQAYLAVMLSVVCAASPARHFFSWQAKLLSSPAALVAALLAVLCGVFYGATAIRQEFHVNLARRAIRNNDFPAAASFARLAATPLKTLDPVLTPVSFLHGYALWKSGHAAQALPFFEQARRENPNRPYILLYLGEAYLASGETGKALECLSLAAQRYPKDIQIREALERARKGPLP